MQTSEEWREFLRHEPTEYRGLFVPDILRDMAGLEEQLTAARWIAIRYVALMRSLEDEGLSDHALESLYDKARTVIAQMREEDVV